MAETLLRLQDLSIDLGGRRVVDGLNLSLAPGERLALVGESGSGKTVTALSIMRLLDQASISGRIEFRGRNLLELPEREMRSLRGGDIAMVFQEPMSALNPLFTIGNQIMETLLQHEALTPRQAREKAIALLARTGIREPERRVDSYPHQLSGGQLQRAVIAMALACRPKLLIADEPTTALDMTIRARIVQLLLELQEEEGRRDDGEGMAILLISHDLHLVRRFAQRVAVMERGQLVETAPVETLFARPCHPYTRRLLSSLPVRRIEPVPEAAPVLLQAEGIRVEYPKKGQGIRHWLRPQRFVALANVAIELREGETIGIVGESGSGKSTLAQAILNLIPVQAGEIRFDQVPHASRTRTQKRALRARLQVVFQDPFGSLSPRQTIARIIGEGLALHDPELSAEERQRRILEVLNEVGLPASALTRYPHEFSGGQRQRIAIARALVLRPRVVVLDEPTSALDLSIQKQVLDLLLRLQRKHGLSYVLISHDLAVVNALAHRIYVLKDGHIVESGNTEKVIARPRHPYTQRLVQAFL